MAYAGNTGWAWEDVRPLFEEIERFMEVRKDITPDPFHQAVIDAAVEAGIPFNPDYNGESQLGISVMQYVIKDGTRNHTARAYLGAVLDHPNLTILTESTARKLLFERDRCIGVEYNRAGGLERAYAESDVVVSGGAIGSPGLLLSSGIGPAAELRARHRRRRRPPGRRTQPARPPALADHLRVQGSPAGDVRDPLHADPPVREERSGSARARPAAAALRAAHVRAVDGAAVADRLHAHGGHGAPAEPRDVKLAGPDPSDGLLIDPHALEAQADVDMVLAAIEIVRSIGSASPLAGSGRRRSSTRAQASRRSGT